MHHGDIPIKQSTRELDQLSNARFLRNKYRKSYSDILIYLVLEYFPHFAGIAIRSPYDTYVCELYYEYTLTEWLTNFVNLWSDPFSQVQLNFLFKGNCTSSSAWIDSSGHSINKEYEIFFLENLIITRTFHHCICHTHLPIYPRSPRHIFHDIVLSFFWYRIYMCKISLKEKQTKKEDILYLCIQVL